MKALPGTGDMVVMQGNVNRKGLLPEPWAPAQLQPHPIVTVWSDRGEGATQLVALLSNAGIHVELQASLWVRALQLGAEPETCCFVPCLVPWHLPGRRV